MQSDNDILPLSELGKGSSAVIVGMRDRDEDLSPRLIELGFITGSIVTAEGKAPFGNPMIFTIHGGKLALRKENAETILVRKI